MPELRAYLGPRDEALEAGRESFAIYSTLPNYLNNLRRLGFDDADFSDNGSDRLIDAIVAHGTVDDILARAQRALGRRRRQRRSAGHQRRSDHAAGRAVARARSRVDGLLTPSSSGWPARHASNVTTCAVPRTSSDRSPSVHRSPCARSRSRPARMIHFFPPHLEKVRAKIPDSSRRSTCCWATSRTPSRPSEKESARAGLVEVAKGVDMGDTQLWTRVNSLDSPWVLDDLTTLVTEIGDKLDVIMIPKVEGAEDIHYVDRLLAQLEARGRARPSRCWCTPSSRRPGASPTSRRSARASPRMQGLSLGPGRPRRQPSDEDDPRRWRSSRLPRAHRPRSRRSRCATRRPRSRTCGTTRSPAWSTPAPPPASCRSTDRSATSATRWRARTSSATPTSSAASVRGRCTRARSRSRSGCSRPTADEVAWAKRVIDEMGDGTGAVMIDGKMQDDASVKQCHVVVELAQRLADRDPELADGLRVLRRTNVTRAPTAPVRAVHARRERQGAREGEVPADRRHHLRPRGLGRARHEGGRPATRSPPRSARATTEP